MAERISEKDFEVYEKIRESGVTNMFNTSNVKEIAERVHDHELDDDKIAEIMQNYGDLKEKYRGDH